MEIAKLQIEGMTCASCVGHVEKAIAKIDGVNHVSVNLATEDAKFQFDPDKVPLSDIQKAISAAGYSAKLHKEKSNNQNNDSVILKSFIFSAIFTAPLLLAMITMLWPVKELMFLHNPLFQLIIATPVQFIAGARFYINAFKSIKARALGMDVLVALGTSTAYGYSIYSGFFSTEPHLYFEASAVIITLILLGRYLESKAKRKTSEAIRKLMAMQPQIAHKLTDTGAIIDVSIDDVIPGDTLVLKPGEQIPVDGTIIKGMAILDESMITGESLPQEKQTGETVFSGSVNQTNVVHFRADKKGADSMLARIIQVVEDAQSNKAPIQKTVDKVASIFVPVVLLISIVTFGIWMLITGDLESALVSSVAILVIACPCALGLATPTAIMVGTGLGAQKGILIRTGESLEQAHKIDTIVLDKTGTITTGNLQVTDIIPAKNNTKDYVLDLAASLESHSEHPIARAVSKAGAGNTIAFSDVKEYPGQGVEGTTDNKTVKIGTQTFVAGSTESKEVHKLEASGKTVLCLGINNEVAGWIAIADTIKEDSAEAIEVLQKRGLDVYMLTGDNEVTAQTIAKSAGINHVLARTMPGQKADKVKELQQKGKSVLMVGDGINDAPALATADISMAMGSGSDIAMESADITLMQSSLKGIADAIGLSKATMSKIKQNLFWAFIYNVIGIPIAAFGLLNPIIAGAAMAFSSVSVLSNSLLLKTYKFTNKRPRQKAKGVSKTMNYTLTVEGMSCGHCKARVEELAAQVQGVSNPTVNLESKILEFSASNSEAIEKVKSIVTDAGYPAE